MGPKDFSQKMETLKWDAWLFHRLNINRDNADAYMYTDSDSDYDTKNCFQEELWIQ